MRPIPPKLREEMDADPYYHECSRAKVDADHSCSGRITWEHVFTFGSKQLNEKWAIIPLCEQAHSVGLFQDRGDLNKEMNAFIALNRATLPELRAVSKAIDYVALRERLNEKYSLLRSRRRRPKNKLPESKLRNGLQPGEVSGFPKSEQGNTNQDRTSYSGEQQAETIF